MTAELRAYAREAAARGGIEPDTFVRQIQQESGFNPQAFNAGSQASGIAQIIERWHPGVNVWDAKASLDYAATWMGQLVRQYGSYRDALIAYNWGPGNLAKWYAASGSPAELPAETRHYLDAILGNEWREPADTIGGNAQSLAYNPSQPPERQIADWVCSIRATSWILKSLGLTVDIGALQDEMSPRYVTPEKGLLDARGYGIAETLKAHLPAEWHDRIHVFPAISWDELASLAGRGPIAVGLRGAYHWLNVARKRADGALDAPNPAPNWHDMGDTLTRQEFDAWGPASAVWVNAETAVAPAPPPPADPRDAEIASLRKQLAERDNLIGYLTGTGKTDVFGALDRALVKARAAADTLRRHAP